MKTLTFIKEAHYVEKPNFGGYWLVPSSYDIPPEYTILLTFHPGDTITLFDATMEYVWIFTSKNFSPSGAHTDKQIVLCYQELIPNGLFDQKELFLFNLSNGLPAINKRNWGYQL